MSASAAALVGVEEGCWCGGVKCQEETGWDVDVAATGVDDPVPTGVEEPLPPLPPRNPPRLRPLREKFMKMGEEGVR